MKLTLRKPDGSLRNLSEDELTIGWNTGEIPGNWTVQRPGETGWRTVAAQLGVPDDSLPSPTTAADGSPVVSGSFPPSSAGPSLWPGIASRYTDAYRVAFATVTIGGTIKVLAIVAGGLALIIPMMGVSSVLASGGSGNAAALLVALVAALAVGVPLYALGILVTAHGQVLKATLDTAVNTSPLLDNEQKAGIIAG